jgi:hypothetical protein
MINDHPSESPASRNQTADNCQQKSPGCSGALNVFVLNLTVTKLVINRVQILTLRRIWSSRGIWILTVRDRALLNGFDLVS